MDASLWQAQAGRLRQRKVQTKTCTLLVLFLFLMSACKTVIVIILLPIKTKNHFKNFRLETFDLFIKLKYLNTKIISATIVACRII